MSKKQAAWKKNRYAESAQGGIYIGPTKGLSSPKNSRRGCLCLDGKKYSIDCCDGYLINQGIGQTEVERGYRGEFSRAFSADFNISERGRERM